MKKFLIILTIIALCSTSYIIGYNSVTKTTNLELVKIAEGDLIFDWFDTMNNNLDLIDDVFDDVTLTEFAFLDGVTSAIQTQLDAKPDEDTNTTYTGTANEITLIDTTFSLHANITRDAEWNTQGEVETIWGVTLATDTELANLTLYRFDQSTIIFSP